MDEQISKNRPNQVPTDPRFSRFERWDSQNKRDFDVAKREAKAELGRGTDGRQFEAIVVSLIGMLDGANILVDKAGTILWRNSGAGKLLRSGRLITAGPDGMLAFIAPPANESFKRALSVLFLHRPTPEFHFSIAPVTGGGENAEFDKVTILAVAPLVAQQNSPLALLVSVRLARPGTGVRVETLQKLFSLTKSEAGVIAELAGGATIEDVARNRGRKQATVRNQQHAAYAKMGVRTQAELVACVAQIMPRLSQAATAGEGD